MCCRASDGKASKQTNCAVFWLRNIDIVGTLWTKSSSDCLVIVTLCCFSWSRDVQMKCVVVCRMYNVRVGSTGLRETETFWAQEACFCARHEGRVSVMRRRKLKWWHIIYFWARKVCSVLQICCMLPCSGVRTCLPFLCHYTTQIRQVL